MEEHEIVRLAAKTAVEQYKVEVGRLFTIDEAADLLNISRTTMYVKLRSGEIGFTEVFGQKKFTMADIDRCKKTARIAS